MYDGTQRGIAQRIARGHTNRDYLAFRILGVSRYIDVNAVVQPLKFTIHLGLINLFGSHIGIRQGIANRQGFNTVVSLATDCIFSLEKKTGKYAFPTQMGNRSP